MISVASALGLIAVVMEVSAGNYNQKYTDFSCGDLTSSNIMELGSRAETQ